MKCHLAGTLVWSQVTLQTGAPVLTKGGNLGVGTPVRSDISYRKTTMALVIFATAVISVVSRYNKLA